MAIQIEAQASPRKTWAKSLGFTFVEGGWYSYRVVIRNVGDMPVTWTRTAKIEVVWTFRNQQTYSGPVKLPDLRQGEQVTLVEVARARVKSPGEASLQVRLWMVPDAPPQDVILIRDMDGRNVPRPNEGEWYWDAQDGMNYFIVKLAHDFLSFWAASQTEVKRMLLIVLAIIGLWLNVSIALYNIFRPR